MSSTTPGALDFMLVPAIAGIALDEAARDPEPAIAAKLERVGFVVGGVIAEIDLGLGIVDGKADHPGAEAIFGAGGHADAARPIGVIALARR